MISRASRSHFQRDTESKLENTQLRTNPSCLPNEYVFQSLYLNLTCTRQDVILVLTETCYEDCIQSPRHSSRQASAHVMFLIYSACIHINIKLTGVGYRDFTQKRAAEFGLKGWVKNTTDGLVEGEAQGDQDSVQKLIQELGKGSRLAHVTKLQKKDITPEEGESHYAVRRTSDSVVNFE
ncbi:acylphosphatase [Aspergillus chevalieri]|uniref:acylphosphatase n=1 Tax=Aspergillus chevalieri TaxID=182096 RepID=A0A7R7VXA1_ASPCH|nr:uncharacterized protein ACHE_80389S [Aspergillus chevalieri]BCR92489.1 hypothetical protein ACHE_80389S [Aspergillus chevalieri]